MTRARLFSNLEFNGSQFRHQPGSLLGCTTLVAGTTIGAGILALPAVTLPSGVVPSSALLLGVWLYTLVSALLIAEVNLNTMRQLGKPGLGFLATVAESLGPSGARITGGAYLFMHYALLVAYMSQGGNILASALATVSGGSVPAWVGTIAFVVLFGGILSFGHQRLVATLNSAFVAIVLVSFVGLLLLGATQVNPSQLWSQDWQALGSAVSVMFVALFYHNIIPVVTTQLEGDVQKIRRSIVIGSAIPLVMFLAWNAVILGSVTPELMQAVAQGNAIFDPIQRLRSGQAGAWLGVLVSVFSEFAIATSFIGFVYGLLDFFEDALTVKDDSQRLPLYSLILLPSASLSILNPSIFFIALDYTGAFSISILGGIIPAVMAWKQRYPQNANFGTQPLIAGGRLTLMVMIGVALAVMVRHGLSTS